MDKKGMERKNGKKRTRSNNSKPIECTKKVLKKLGFSDEEIERLRHMPKGTKKPWSGLWKRVYNKCYLLRDKGNAEDIISIVNGDENFMDNTRKIIGEAGFSQCLSQCEIEFPSENSAASNLKVEIAPLRDRWNSDRSSVSKPAPKEARKIMIMAAEALVRCAHEMSLVRKPGRVEDRRRRHHGANGGSCRRGLERTGARRDRREAR